MFVGDIGEMKDAHLRSKRDFDNFPDCVQGGKDFTVKSSFLVGFKDESNDIVGVGFGLVKFGHRDQNSFPERQRRKELF